MKYTKETMAAGVGAGAFLESNPFNGGFGEDLASGIIIALLSWVVLTGVEKLPQGSKKKA